MPFLVRFVLLFAATIAVVEVRVSPITPREGEGYPTINLHLPDAGDITGFYKPTFSKTREVVGVLGIPFVDKPKRFEPPTRFANWSGIRDGTKRARACPQGKFYPDQMDQQIAKYDWPWAKADETDPTEDDAVLEDCLTLDVYFPKDTPANSRLPVFLFFHGGAFVRGSAISVHPDFVLDHAEPMVVVSAQYRLGPLGFLAAGGRTPAGKGNAGLWDQVWAIRWTKKFVGYFGGDPDHIVIGGVSAGGATSGLLYVSPVSNELVKGAMLFSGCGVVSWAVDNEPRRSSQGIASETVCRVEAQNAKDAAIHENEGLSTHENTLNAEDALVDCLANKASVEELLEATWIWARSEKQNKRVGMGGTIPVLDGEGGLLPEMPADLMRKEEFKSKTKPLLVGISREEGLYLYVQIHGFYIKVHNLDNDSETLSRKIGEIMLNFAGVEEHSEVLGTVVQKQFFREEQLGNYELMKAGMIDFTGAVFFKGPAHQMVQLNADQGGDAWLYTFNYANVQEREEAKAKGTNPEVNHSADQVYLFPSNNKNFTYYDEDYEMVKKFSRMIVDFITTLKPTPKGTTAVEGAHWPSFTRENDAYLAIEETGWEARTGFDKEYYATNNYNYKGNHSPRFSLSATTAVSAALITLMYRLSF